MQLKIANIPQEVIKHDNLMSLVTPDGNVYCEITQGMYSLPQAGIIAQELLKKSRSDWQSVDTTRARLSTDSGSTKPDQYDFAFLLMTLDIALLVHMLIEAPWHWLLIMCPSVSP